MNASLKAAAVEASQTRLFQLSISLIHFTPFLNRRRRKHWEPRFTHERRPRRHHHKHSILRNIDDYADVFFQSWVPFSEHEDMRERGPSWFTRKQGANESREKWNPNQGHKRRRRRDFDFCDNVDVNVETVFRSAFGGERVSFWSFVNEGKPGWGGSTGFNSGHRASWHWSYGSDHEGTSSDDDSSESTSASDRLALGLSPSGPLQLEDVKHAYRTCALKFHPDRHQGPSKNAAEEKFKVCTAAYQSLCDKLAMSRDIS